MMNLVEFKKEMIWVMQNFHERELIDIYGAICTESYESIEDIETAIKEGFLDGTYFADKTFTGLMMNVDHMSTDEFMGLLHQMSNYENSMRLHYLHKDDVYAMTLGFQ